jgi:hypothetical protein
MLEVLPWNTSGALTIFPPNAAPIAWCPRHTPRIGTVEDLISSTDIPAA